MKESVIQEAGTPRLVTDSGSQVAWWGISGMRLKLIFSRCMEHRGTKMSSLCLYRQVLLHFRRSGESQPCD